MTRWFRGDAPAAPLPRGWHTGEAVYETLLAPVGGPLPAVWGRHLERFAISARLCQLPWPGDARVTRAASQALTAGIDGQAQGAAEGAAGDASPRCRLRLNLVAAGELRLSVPPSDAELWVAVSPLLSVDPTPLRLALGPNLRNPADPLTGAKRVSIASDLLARRAAVAAGYDDVLLRDLAGHLSEASTSCLLVGRDDGSLWTPAPATGALPSTTLALLRDVLPIEPACVRGEELRRSDWAVLLNAVVGARAVASVGQLRLSPAPPEIVALARRLVRDGAAAGPDAGRR